MWDKKTFINASVGGFVGKLLGSVFVAVCAVLGFGPDEWVQFMMGSNVAPWIARGSFLLLAIISAWLLLPSDWKDAIKGLPSTVRRIITEYRLRVPWERKTAKANALDHGQPTTKTAPLTANSGSSGNTLSVPDQAAVAQNQRSLTPYDVEQKLKTCDELLEFVRKRTVRIPEDGNRMLSNPWQQTKIGAAAYVERLVDFRNDVRTLRSEMNNWRNAHSHHPKIVSALPGDKEMENFTNAVTAFSMAIERLAKLQDLPEAVFNFLLEPRHLEFDNSNRKFARWHNDAVKKLCDMRIATSH